ncbi:MAG: RNA polymerase-associated protein RapA [Candidatus Erwinia impunctatus]|nr:RNA polymerase-associated protein RapA [Culicoides impunctatus]
MCTVRYNEKQVSRWMGARTVTRARPLVDKVQNARWENGLLTAEVPVGNMEPLQVIVHFSRPQGRLLANGECDCPVKNNCRHVAAVMLACLQQPARDAEQTSQIVIPAVQAPKPRLFLRSRGNFISGFGHYGHRQKHLDYALLVAEYGTTQVVAGFRQEQNVSLQGQVISLPRQWEEEQQWLDELAAAGLTPLPTGHIYTPPHDPLPPMILVPGTPGHWRDVLNITVPLLRQKGWQVSVEADFTWNIEEVSQINSLVTEQPQGHLQLEMQAVTASKPHALRPLLNSLLQHDSRWLSSEISLIPDEERIILRGDDNQRLQIAAGLLKPLVASIKDLLPAEPTETLLILSREDIGRLNHAGINLNWQGEQSANLQTLLALTTSGASHTLVSPPRGLQATLRDYQLQGVSWMQALRASQLAGILADDMGLGKTIQTLAHILAEKEAGRLRTPALIVVPTSLVCNWQQEAERFTPSLKVLALHGPQRHDQFAAIAGVDIVVTTYPLLWRDQQILSGYEYHLLILDEAQHIKNSTSRAATVIRLLTATHRLCLTGTPLENHLGELWSLFDFLMPGFLSGQKQFVHDWQLPIERQQDQVKLDLLARRLRPFMLRRHKQDVAKELPPKNTIIRPVTMAATQREWYEVIRDTMQKKVQQAVTLQGEASSHLLILEALLKMRQVCCDPRLLGEIPAKTARHSAKLMLLRQMLPGLLAEGRHILVFSQFTSMLALIEEELKSAHIDYLLLTGETRHRQQIVERFQRGEAQVFLISLKAGGTGLNLTRADTVILYDPWWNPAVENQAVDRAYRIGQDKPVFVYKLIAAGTIEEKILRLQEQKSALAGGILETETGHFTLNEWQALFE